MNVTFQRFRLRGLCHVTNPYITGWPFSSSCSLTRPSLASHYQWTFSTGGTRRHSQVLFKVQPTIILTFKKVNYFMHTFVGDDHQMNRERRTEEQVQLLPESGLARRHAATSYLGLGKVRLLRKKYDQFTASYTLLLHQPNLS